MTPIEVRLEDRSATRVERAIEELGELRVGGTITGAGFNG